MAENLPLALASVVVLGIGAQWLAWRIRLPAILLLLVFGLVAGPFARMLGLPDALEPANVEEIIAVANASAPRLEALILALLSGLGDAS